MKKILAVDNHPVVLKFMKGLLEKEGHRVLTAEDGLAAMEALNTYVPDVIFVDLIMPNIDGKKLCMLIRNMPELSDVYLVIMSAIAVEDNINPAEFGADTCIVKGQLNKMGQHVLTVIDALERDCSEELSGSLIGIEDVYERDVTKELLSAARHYEAVFDNMDDGIVELSSEGKIVYVNSAGISIIGIAEEKLLGSDFADIFREIHGKTIEPFPEMTDEAPPAIAEQAPMSGNGKQVLLKEINIKDEKIKSSFVIIRDITERKRIEDSLRHAQTMEAVGVLAGGIAHEFNNALAGVSGNVEMLQMDFPAHADAKKYFKSIENCTDRMAKLTDQLLAYARGGKYLARTISVNDFIKDTLPLIMHTVDSSIQVKTDLSGDDMYADADFSQLQTALSALLSNASEAIEDEGRICISTENVVADQDVLKNIPELKVGKYVCLTIEDNGKGMEKAVEKRIFDPFFTTKFQGRGLGMAATYGIVRNHGGTISVDSELGKGTRVHICLPAVECEAKEAKTSGPENTKGAGTILIIDDEDVVLNVNKALLERLGFRTMEAQSGVEAIEILKEFKNDIDVALLDIKLPDMGGDEIYSFIKEVCPHINVIVCSGYGPDGPVREVLDAGAQDFIQKPFTLSELSEKLHPFLKEQ